jgi:hypothetical protein
MTLPGTFYGAIKIDTRIVGEVALDYFRPVLSRYNFYIEDGILSAAGKIEYTPKITIIRLIRGAQD